MADTTTNSPEPELPIREEQVTSAPFDQNQTDRAAESAEPESPKPSGAAQLLKDGASRLSQEATDRARAYAEDGRGRAAELLDELARMMTDAAGSVDEKLGEQFGQYARTAASSVEGFSGTVKAKDLDELVDDARAFVQKSPAVAIGSAAALGFVLVRLIRSGLDSATIDGTVDKA